MHDSTITALIAVAAVITLIFGSVAILLFTKGKRDLEKERHLIEREGDKRLLEDTTAKLRQSEERLNELNALFIESVAKISESRNGSIFHSLEIAHKSDFLRTIDIKTSSLTINPRLILYISPKTDTMHQSELDVVKSTCQNLDYTLIDDFDAEDPETGNKFIEKIIQSSLIIVNLNLRDSGVFYHLAIAQMLDKRIIILTHSADDRSSYLMSLNQPILFYHTTSELENKLKDAVKKCLIDLR